MGKLSSMYTKYFQKSRVFLYPILQIPKGSVAAPMETYVSWEGYIKPEEKKLICSYKDRVDLEYKKFEKTKLLQHPLLHSTEMVDGNRLMIFDFSKYGKDWDKFLLGSYSTFEYNTKMRISKWHGNHTTNSVYIDSYINPHKYFDIYASILDVTIKELKKVGELCDKPNLEKECLTSKVKFGIYE
jgi:hypothetical protein